MFDLGDGISDAFRQSLIRKKKKRTSNDEAGRGKPIVTSNDIIGISTLVKG